MKREVVADIEVRRYNGPKKSNMYSGHIGRNVLPLRVLAAQNVLLKRSQDLDLCFF